MGNDGTQHRVFDRLLKGYRHVILRGERNIKGAAAPSHCGNVQRSTWLVRVFATSSTVYVPKWAIACPTGLRGLSDAVFERSADIICQE
jgi:hypothetical protein